jgi:hypothetical protein
MAGLVGLPPFEPIDSVTPFTYRDNATYLSILKTLETTVNALIDNINEVSINNAGGLNAFKTYVDDALTALRAELLELINSIELDNGATVLDPTTGNRTEALSKALGNVYDNARIFAYFAKQYDDLNLTAADYDALMLKARHYDLAPTYPTLSDVQI